MATRDLLLQANGGVCSRDAARHTGDAALNWQGMTNANDGNSGTQASAGGGLTAYTDYLKGDLGATRRVTSINIKGPTSNDFDGLEYWNGSSWVSLPATWDGLGFNNPAGATYTLNTPGYVDAQLFEIKARQQSSAGITIHTWTITGDDTPRTRTKLTGFIG